MIDIKELRQAIRRMTRQQALYRILRDELSALGYWRRLSRGDPSKGYQAMKRKQKR